MNSKERAQFRKQAMTLETIIQIGKDGVTDAVIKTAEQSITNRELIKLTVLENADLTAREVADLLAEKIHAEVIQVIGRKFVLYKFNKDKKRK